MESNFVWENGCLTIRLPGEVDHTAADELRRKTERFMKRYFTTAIIFDFQNTQFMDSSGIGLIMGRYRALGLRGGCVQAIHVNDYIARMLRISGVHKYITIQKEEEYGKHQ